MNNLVDEAPYHPGYEDAAFAPAMRNANATHVDFGFLRGMIPTNQPVAWLFVLDGCRCVTLDEDASYEIQHNGTPLYAHPVKELTDEEITEVFYSLDVGHNATDFAKAILRKAGEK